MDHLRRILLVTACLTFLASPVLLLDNGLALTPPMGWLSWERFLCNVDCENDPRNCISERLYKDMADRLVADGFRDLGYEYVNIDDCWLNMTRDSEGKLVADRDRFPSGIKALADYMHSKGLKLGIYQDCGTKTCAGYPGSYGHFDVDAELFAEWGVDMLKLDGCYADPKEMDLIYPNVTAALNKTGRPILFSCSWPDYQRASGFKVNYTNIAKYCNIWRNMDDISDSWQSVSSILDYYISVQDELAAAAGPGNFNDPDMVIIGNFGLSHDQNRAQMALWAILAAPLLMSNDLRDLAPAHRAILKNREVIAVNQDKLGMMGKRIQTDNNIEVWTRPITPTGTNSSYSYAVVIFNRQSIGGPSTVTYNLSKIGLNYINGYKVEDILDRHYFGIMKPADNVTLRVNPSGVRMFTAKIFS